AEDEEGSPWEPLSADRGVSAGTSAVTLFAGEGTRCIVDQKSRTPESLASTFAVNLRALHHPKLALAFDAMLVISPEHARVLRDAGWTKARLLAEIGAPLQIPWAALAPGAHGIAEGMPDQFRSEAVPKFRPGGLLLVHAGGTAGLFSELI